MDPESDPTPTTSNPDESEHNSFDDPLPKLEDSVLEGTISLTPNQPRSSAMESLFSKPLKFGLSEVEQLTPGQQNTVLGKGILSLGINSPITPNCALGIMSPMTPNGTKCGKGDTALTPVNRNKRMRQNEIDEFSIDEEEPGFKRSCKTPVERSDEPRPKFWRSQSESGVPRCIKHAMDEKENNPLLVGDCSRPHSLPLTAGSHHDLKEISSQTLVDLVEGKFKADYSIIDCRYPYEYAGGHVKGAINLYTESQVYQKYFEDRKRTTTCSGANEHIVVFHCEFSKERGPKMCRAFRDWDRTVNMASFPSLFYPEMYVLHRGYKGFYESHPHHCEPSNYTKMVEDPEKLRYFVKQCKGESIKTKSKSVPSKLGSGRSFSAKKLML